MIISALKSNDASDHRSPIHIDTISALIELDSEILFEEGIGEGIYTSDKEFLDKGLKAASRDECIASWQYIHLEMLLLNLCLKILYLMYIYLRLYLLQIKFQNQVQ